MGDHLNLQFNIEIYDRCEMEFNGQGKIVSDMIKQAINKELKSLGFGYETYFVSGGL